MKLLADQPTVDVEEPPHRPILAILGGVAVLILMIGVGLVLLLSGDGNDEQPTADAAEVADQAPGETLDETTDMAAWTAEADAACRAAGDSPLVATGESVAEVEGQVRSLVVAIREIAVPADREARALILPIVLRGDEAETAWSGIAGLDRDEVTDAELDTANALTDSFVNGLVDIGANCSPLTD